MIASQAEADVNVIALIGERGRDCRCRRAWFVDAVAIVRRHGGLAVVGDAAHDAARDLVPDAGLAGAAEFRNAIRDCPASFCFGCPGLGAAEFRLSGLQHPTSGEPFDPMAFRAAVRAADNQAATRIILLVVDETQRRR